MGLSRYEFEILCYLEQEGKGQYPVRQISDTLLLSGTIVSENLEQLQKKGFLKINEKELEISAEGLDALEPYRVKRAIILAAGFGSRMMPATADRPKPMVSVNGKRIIDTLLDALEGAGITDITIVGGYRYDKLKELQAKYPTLQLIENKDYAVTNNISSAMLVLDKLQDGCYLCEADLYITNPKLITKYQHASNILGAYSVETDDWCFKMSDGYIEDYRKGNTHCYNYYGISYWTAEDCAKLRRDFARTFSEGEEGKNYFWEFIPLVLCKNNYQVELRPCERRDIMEIDNFYELVQLDASYGKDYSEGSLVNEVL